MNRIFALLGFIALFLLSVRAQDDSSSLCELNFLRFEDSDDTGDFLCSKNITETLTSKNITLTPLTDINLNATLSNENRVIKFVKKNVSGTFNDSLSSGSTFFTLLVAFADESDDDSENDTETFVSAVMAAVSYDFDGDGIVDRVELYNAFVVNKTQLAASNASDAFQSFIGSIDNIDQVIGSEFKDMDKGSITLTVWSPFGSGPLLLKVGGVSLSDNETSSDEFSTISFPFDFETNATGGTSGGGAGGACCDRIDALESDLEELKAKVDAISSRLLSITRTCCAAAGTATATAVSTATAVETATATVVETATGTASGTSAAGTA